MIFALVLAPAALAVNPCDLPAAIGGAATCKTHTVDDSTNANDDKAFGYFDADEVAEADQTVHLTISGKTSHVDHNSKTHDATFGAAPSYDGARYLLDCEQKKEAANTEPQWIPATGAPAGTTCTGPTAACVLNEKYFNGEHKTLKLTVERPATFGANDINFFQGEFLNMYKKDSWEVLRTEHEPYTHNNYGSVVPLDEFRVGAQDLNVDNSESTSPYFNVYMAAPNDGDFEFRYGNPNLVLGRTATGDELAACLKAGPNDSGSNCGTWTSVSFSKSMLRVGTPWKSCGTDGGSTLANTEQEIGAILPAYIGHPNLKKTEYETFTTAARTSTIETYVVFDIFSPNAGNGAYDAATETTTVHESNIDKWTYSSTGDAKYNGKDRAGAAAEADAAASTLTVPCQEDDWTLPNDPTMCSQHGSYSKCYEAGTPCPLNHNVCKEEYCNINRWGAIKDALTNGKTNIKTLGFIETMQGVGNLIPRPKEDILKDVAKYGQFAATTVDGFFFNRVDSTNTQQTTELKEVAATLSGKKIVFSTGQALADPSLLTGAGAPDIVVTLSADKEAKKEWNPFAWFPDELPTQWGALLTNVASGEADVAKLLFDRGYGYVGLHAAAGENAYGTVSTTLTTALSAIATADKSTSARRLQEVTSTFEWSCDAAQFYCAPVCMRTTGVVTSIVPDAKCAGQKQTCSCSCLYDAHWDCVDGAVVCKATHTTRLEPEIVGDLVCATRGTEKPTTCIRQLTARGTYPEQQCMTQFQEEKETRLKATKALEEAAAAREAARVARLAEMNTKPTEPEQTLNTLDVQSSALPAALLALAGLFA